MSLQTRSMELLIILLGCYVTPNLLAVSCSSHINNYENNIDQYQNSPLWQIGLYCWFLINIAATPNPKLWSKSTKHWEGMYQKVSIVEWLNNAHSVYNNFQILMLLNKKCLYSIHSHEHNASPYLAIEICLQNNGLNFGQSNSSIYIMSNPFDKNSSNP